MPDASSLEIARLQIQSARTYTEGMLEGLEPEDWFQVPGGCTTHIAWQVGHLAMAEYGLCLLKVRGRQPEDRSLMPRGHLKLFGRGSVPELDREKHPPVDELLDVFRRIHQRAMEELATYDPALLDEPAEMPYAAYPTKYGGVLFCAHHEMLHAGQIGLLRRLMGRDPVR